VFGPTAVIIDAVRSPIGKGKLGSNGRPGGSLSALHPVELLAQMFRALFDRTPLDPGTVDDVMVGCVSQVAEQGYVPGRMAWLAAGLPENVPSVMIDRRCGSSQQAADFAAQAIMSGAASIVVAAGVESMSRVPMGSARAGADAFGPSVTRRYHPGLVSQGIAAELIAATSGLRRDELDDFSARSHARAAAASAGGFAAEIVPVQVPAAGGVTTVARDETIRPGTDAATLATLEPAFRSAEMEQRFPQIRWCITAGNSSQLADGASAVLMMSDQAAARLGLTPRARIAGMAVAAGDPVMMLTAPIPATAKLLDRAGLALEDIDLYEVNEAFAPVPLAWQQHFHTDGSRLNVRGGAIALGHPLGASGARLLTTLLCSLEAASGRYGLVTMCEAGGTANATLIERL
jgi:acetyl-CoA acetyltransferase family protein